MKNFFAAFVLFTIAYTGLSYAQTISHSSISFKIKNLGVNTNGTIGGLQADVHFNPADLTTSTLSASLDVNTLNTDNSSRDEHLRSEDFFDLAKYPKITIKSVAFKHKSGDNYAGTFNLTIKDKTKSVEIPFTYADKGNSFAFNSTFKINRRDFGVGGSSMILSDEVNVTVAIETSK